MVEIIKCRCGTIFAACVDGCQDRDWHKSKATYLKAGCSSELVSKATVDYCDCPKEIAPAQLTVWEKKALRFKDKANAIVSILSCTVELKKIVPIDEDKVMGRFWIIYPDPLCNKRPLYHSCSYNLKEVTLAHFLQDIKQSCLGLLASIIDYQYKEVTKQLTLF